MFYNQSETEFGVKMEKEIVGIPDAVFTCEGFCNNGDSGMCYPPSDLYWIYHEAQKNIRMVL